MISINVPKSAYPAIQSLIGLSQSDFDALLEALSRAKPALGRGNFWKHVAPLVPQIKEPEIKNIVNEILDMAEALELFDMEADELATGIVEAIDPKEWTVSDGDKQTLKSRLAKVFGGKKGLAITLKAMGVMVDQERTFFSAKILTDVRAVFNENAESVEGAVIVHNLRIHYGQEGEHKDFYVALDTSDIDKLREVLDRADMKAKTLESLLKRSEVSYLDAGE